MWLEYFPNSISFVKYTEHATGSRREAPWVSRHEWNKFVMENATEFDKDKISSRSWLVNQTQLDVANDYLPNWTDLVLAICFSILIVITIVGNTLVIAAVITTRRLRSVTNCFVSSLAAADLLVGLAVMPPAVLLQLNGGTWELGEVLCDSWVSLDVLLCTASILSLCAISIDRYLAVTQPLIYSRRRRSKRLAGLMIVVVWILAGAITSPPLLGCFPRARNVVETEKKCSYNMDSSYVVFSAMGSFFLPMLVMLYVYGRISCVIAKRHRSLESADAVSVGENRKSPNESINCTSVHRRTQRRHFHATGVPSTNHVQSSKKPTVPQSILVSRHSTASIFEGTTSDAGNAETKSPAALAVPCSEVGSSPCRKIVRTGTLRSHQHSCINRVTRETKTAGTLAVVVGGFVACWLPFFILYLATPFIPVEPPDPLMPALTWLGWINSAINPFIYAFYSADFRMAFWRLTCRKCLRSRFESNPGAERTPQAAPPSWRRQTSRTLERSTAPIASHCGSTSLERVPTDRRILT
ncbi:PREDICTED: 5-hydroxytryptamine receptor 7-like [Ceratosolen solmsi marchali]|uniref:5-hydroxytryptamine receptor 7-like n=1 Tax=Ceratosolen solmsi marchali TaxID=326594 RepID=A0AAJ6YLR0_9HYME|nr:PREDICTED: 5-hydroxytryptamine receptor 7-like [Ceratosolen solmsi marchali]